MFRGGQKIDEVVGANIGAVERKVKQYSFGESGQAASTATGYTLGGGQRSATGGQGGGIGVPALATDPDSLYTYLAVAFCLWVAYQWALG